MAGCAPSSPEGEDCYVSRGVKAGNYCIVCAYKLVRQQLGVEGVAKPLSESNRDNKKCCGEDDTARGCPVEELPPWLPLHKKPCEEACQHRTDTECRKNEKVEEVDIAACEYGNENHS